MNNDIFKAVFDVFSLPYPGAYMTTVLFASFMTVPVMLAAAHFLGVSRLKTFFMPFICIPAGLVTSRVFSVLFDGSFSMYAEKLSEEGLSYFFTGILNPLKAGHVFYGGLFGGWIVGSLYTLAVYRGDRKKYLLTADTVAFAAAMGAWISRIGCFFEGCCFGRICSWCGVKFPANSKTMFILHRLNPDKVTLFEKTPPLIPTQLIHSFSNFIIFVFLIFQLRKHGEKKPGYYAFTFLFLYSFTRFLIEFLRYDPRGSLFYISTSQWISIMLFFLLFMWRKKQKQAEANAND
ncbi:MAG: prolipoprotein diacylglyceryl transferase [bacterium]